MMSPTPSQDQLETWDRTHYWHAFTQMEEYEPLIIERAEGVWLYDIKGRRLLDGASSMWCNVHGHNHPVMNKAIEKQLHRVCHATSLGMSCDVTIELSKRLIDVTPGGLEHVFFSSDGSSANEVALKAAFQYWRQCDTPQPQKTKYLAFGQAYHGDTLGAASVGGIGKFHDIFQPLLFEVIRTASPDVRRLPPGVTGEAAAQYFLDEVETVLQANADELAAIVIEPLVQGAAGMAMQPLGFVRGLRQLATQYNVLLIVDEVATGFGRTGSMFACDSEQISPDFLTLGKGLTGGYLPMAATLTSNKIWRTFLGDAASGRALYHGHTYSGNPLSAAAAMACLDLFEAEQTLEQLPAKIEHLGDRLSTLAEHPHVINARQRGMVVALDLVADKQTGQAFGPEQRVGQRLAAEALNRGVWLRARPDMAYTLPPLAISHDEIDLLMDAMAAGIDAATS
ncbi:adenosylmethionine--8-amino-7-oxononanoate transaminase [Aeoliella mucimassa]|uniref:Adenosylmethionine-8-amino-7-oxononanoate aminotransferase n=1 Tax=Aeoliella mucimassa TaxID=2527972 RepID=A0A518ANY2_9BACT|nr:adenosylmethionine--8-amino-7-oxononanoate transaminase [Aeoliella mucimassa]QDU56433.1 L-Lysine-8-amino-7-oxononanoate aminotransferase [Aeoliella mucimassa]